MTTAPAIARADRGRWDAFAVRRLASRIDKLPFSPASLGDKLVDLHLDGRDRRAAFDPEWAAIEARRTGPGSQYKTLLSDDLTWDDWDRQTEIADRLTPAPVWLPLARRLSQLKLTHAAYATVRVAQRAARGWADSDTWNLGVNLARTTGAQLGFLADIAHGWPGGPEFPTYEDWTKALAVHSQALLAYAAEPDDEKFLEDARTSLRWVADHLGALWD